MPSAGGSATWPGSTATATAARRGLAQGRSLQYTTYSTAGLPPATATRLVGAVALAPADPTARPDRAAGLVLAHLRFLASGAEGE